MTPGKSNILLIILCQHSICIQRLKTNCEYQLNASKYNWKTYFTFRTRPNLQTPFISQIEKCVINEKLFKL